MDYPYVKVQGNLKKMFGNVQLTGVPPKFTQKSLAAIGFKSTNDRAILNVLKFIGFTNSDGVPNDLWKQYRNKDVAPTILGQAIKSAYSDLFSVYSDAHLKDTQTLRNFFSVNTSVGEQALSAIVQTFKSLCELATFSEKIGEGTPDHVVTTTEQKFPKVSEQLQTSSVQIQGHSRGLAVNVNIELHLPSTTDGEVYDKLFDALKRHLLQS